MTDNVFKLKTRSQMNKKREFQRCLIRKVDVYFEVTTVSGEKIRTKSLVVALRAVAEYFEGLDPKAKTVPLKPKARKKSPSTKAKKRKP